MSEFRIVELLFKTNDFCFYKAIHEPTQVDVLLRDTAGPYTTDDLHNEFQFHLDHTIPHTVPLLMVSPDGLIMKAEYGKQLRDLDNITIADFLQIAMQLTDILMYFHSKGITSKRVSVNQIIKVTQARFQIVPFPAAYIEALPVYQSPESFVNGKKVDERSDLYSLGVLLYEILARQAPFAAKNRSAWAHQHLAVMPKSLKDAGMGIPQVLDQMILTLLEKDPDRRYQSAAGLKKDLKKCFEIIQAGFPIPYFKLLTHPHEPKFSLPTYLYGREKEARLLYETYQRTAFGSTELVYLYGSDGIGKSSLITQQFKKLIGNKGYFISGRFDQMEKNIPYESFIQMFSELVQQILSQTDESVAGWKQEILTAVGENGRILTSVIPELSLIIGEQPEVEELSTLEMDRRFEFVFRSFVDLFATVEHPLVMFLDDIHRADKASIRLMNTFLTDPNSSGLLVIATYRESKLDKIKNDLLAPEQLEAYGVNVTSIGLKNLSVQQINRMVADALGCEKELCEELAELLYRKTIGNPFYLHQLLTIIHKSGWLYFDHKQQQWGWDYESIRNIEHREQIVEMMIEKIELLPEQTKQVLVQASCLGHSFSNAALRHYLNLSPAELDPQLDVLVEAGLLIQTDKDESVNYQFFHDRIQAMAYSLMDASKKKQIHVMIGRDLVSSGTFSYEKVNHLNKGKDLITDRSELVDLMKANQTAGKMSKNSSAYDTARHYFREASSILVEADWQQDYSFCFDLSIELAESEYLCGYYEEADRLHELLMKRAKNWGQKARVYGKQLNQLVNQGKYNTAIEMGLAHLAEVGVRVPNRPSVLTVGKEVYWTKMRLPKDFDQLKQLPMVEDAHIKTMMDVMFHLLVPSFFANKEVFAILNCKLLRLTLKYGQSTASPAVYAAYATMLCTELGAYQQSYQLGKAAVELADERGLASVRCKTYVMFGGVMCQWNNHRRDGLPYLKEAIKLGLRSGDYVYTNMAIGTYINAIYPLESLATIINENRNQLDVLDQTKDDFVAKNVRLFVQVSRCLQGQTNNKIQFSDDEFDETAFLESVIEDDSQHVTFFQYYTYKTQLHVLYNNYAEAIEMAAKAKGHLKYTNHLPHLSEYYFYEALAILRGWDDWDATKLPDLKKRLQKAIKKLKVWNKNSKENFQHMLWLIEAEYAQVKNEHQLAQQLYHKAINEATEMGYHRNAAIGMEMTGIYYHKLGYEKVASVYMVDAWEAFKQWGAIPKTKELQYRYPAYFKDQVIAEPVEVSEQATVSAENYAPVDLSAIIHSSQKLWEDMDASTIVNELLNSIAKHASAQKCLLLIKDEQQLYIGAQLDEVSGYEYKRIAMLDELLLPHAMVRYVSRSGKQITVDQDNEYEEYRFDPYIFEYKPKSVRCIPIQLQGNLSGILYIENRWIANVFANVDQEVLKYLASQALFFMKVTEAFNEPTSDEGAALATEHEDDVAEADNVEELSAALTEREVEILNLMAAGLTNNEIAQKLGLKLGTIKVHNHNIYSKLEVNRRTKAVVKAKEMNLIDQ
ncbi:AAA family ATPase [Radiobacillus sp. PE A8.2]|uniref:AAA family ATPase n=1 Tax=Radiobacillus sp. PE A8.2 TaxID=3380349 RepID=UPI00388E7AE5